MKEKDRTVVLMNLCIYDLSWTLSKEIQWIQMASTMKMWLKKWEWCTFGDIPKKIRNRHRQQILDFRLQNTH